MQVWTIGAAQVEIARLQRGDLTRHDGVPATIRMGRGLHHRGARLFGIVTAENFLTGGQQLSAMCQHGPALEHAPELAACDNLLSRVTALLEIHAADRLVIEHLRNKGFNHRRIDHRHTGLDVAKLPAFQFHPVARG